MYSTRVSIGRQVHLYTPHMRISTQMSLSLACPSAVLLLVLSLLKNSQKEQWAQSFRALARVFFPLCMHTMFLTSLKTTDTCQVGVRQHASYRAGGAGVLHLTQLPSGVGELIRK